jgi:type IV pilus assembly protein PilB
MMREAVDAKASDIHLDMDRDRARVRYRIDGVLHEALELPKEAGKPIVSRARLLADCDINERRLPQSGRIRVSFDGFDYDFRTATLPSVYGESMVMRILDQGSVLIGFDRLGMSERTRAILDERFHVPQGLIIVVGPAGSGRTTTVYSALNQLNDPKRKIVTIEEPVEYALRGMTQVHVNRKAGLLPAGALRFFMRCDPDIVMLGELRDVETAEMCANAAMTGHLVFTTMLGSDTASAVTRLIEMGLEPFLAAASVSTVVAQRLVRRICPDCKEPHTPSPEALRRVETETGLDLSGSAFYRGRGCGTCRQTGYKGRTGLFEILAVTEPLREVIARPASASVLRQTAREDGMITMLQDGVEKAAAGITTLEEVLRVLSSAY